MTERRWQLPAMSRGALIAVIAVAVGVVALFALYLGAVVSAGSGVRPGVEVAGVPIGGLPPSEAREKLQVTVGADARKRFRVVAGDQEFSLKPRQSGLTFDPRATVDQVVGRTWNPFTLINELTTTRSVDPVIDVDQAVLDAQIASIASAINTEPVEPALTVGASGVEYTPGTPGSVLDEQALADEMIASLLQPRAPLTAPMIEEQPEVTAEEAQAAVDLAEQAISAPVTVNAEGTVAEIPASAIAEALSFTKENGNLVPVLDGAVLHEAIREQLKAIETPGRDARFKIKKGVPVVVPAKVGRGVEDGELADKVLSVLSSDGAARTVGVSVGVRDPELSTEDAEALGITERLSTFTQKFPYAAYRVTNIGQAAEYVNGTILMPGDTFSMNETIKERTEKNGYTVGTVIGPGGVFEEALGGGVSAATTAVWTAAFFAGMERVDTRAHSVYISRYQPGLEATVAWGIFDMQFRNDQPYPVLITTKMTNTSMTVDFWGTRFYDEVDAEFGPRTDIRKYQTIYKKQKKRDGCTEQSGIDGFNIVVDRVFFKDGQEVKREPIQTVYRSAPQVVCGKSKKEAEAEANGVRPGDDAEDLLPIAPSEPGTTPSATPSPSASRPLAENEFVN